MKRISIFTMFWGDQYTSMFYKYQLPSLMQDGNLPLLAKMGYDIQWHIYSPEAPKVNNPFFVYHKTDDTITVNCLRDFMTNNLDAMCFMIYPDIFVGNYTMAHSVLMVENKPNMCLCVAHPRVSLQKLNDEPILAKTNAQLVDFAFKHAHKCLWAADDNLDTNMTWGGISWRQVGEKNYAVIHNLATPWVYQFTSSDIGCICSTHGGCMDRGFVEKLQNEGRVKICGSSDLCFFVEITSDSHDQPLYPGQKYNDKPGHGEENSDYWNNMIVNWRRE